MKIKQSVFLIRLLAFSFFAFILYVFLTATFRWDNNAFKLLKEVPYFDKYMHFILIGGFAFFTNLLLRNRKIPLLKWSVLLGSLCVFVLMTLEEFSQIFVASRTFDLIDLTCNYAGIILIGNLAKKIDVMDKDNLR